MTNKLNKAGDPWVLEVQEWLNKTYSGRAGYKDVPENGKTGWPTVYGLIRALQLELGLTPADNFGVGTSTTWDAQVRGKLKDGWKHNIVQIIDGAFRVKGFGDGKFDNVYTDKRNGNTIKSFKEEAGFTLIDTSFNSMWAKAVFDMSAFRLVSGGNSSTREMQQTLNRKYYQYTGILPCDGIYQRATNTALIYGIQSECSVAGANGNFGPGTQAAYKAKADAGLQSFPDLVLLVQYGLYQNVKDLDLGVFSFTSTLDSSTTNVIAGFQKFMKLSGVQSGYPDLRTMMSLALSNGDTTRPCTACDTSHQLTDAKISTLKAQGFNTVGRYLTGSVGSDFRPKSLSRAECTRIFNADMNIFAIYQDNVYVPKPSHFNASVGYADARKAIAAAKTLGIPSGETIYFAIDVDCQDTEIDQYVLPYFKSISEQFLASGYKYGVYGTRNVCKRVEYTFSENPPQGLFISNMSSGFSGNLGFPQPKNWTFDQFYEVPNGIGSGSGFVEVDKVANSGKDNGFSTLEGKAMNKATAFAYSLGMDGFVDVIAGGEVNRDKEYTIPLGPGVEMKVTISETLENTGNFQFVFDIKNSKISGQAQASIENVLGNGLATNSLVATLDNFTAGVKTGQVGMDVSLHSDGSYEVSLVINSEELDFEGGTIQMSAAISLKMNPNIFTQPILDSITILGVKVEPQKLLDILGFSLTIGALAVIVGSAGIGAGVTAVLAAIALFLEQVIPQFDGTTKG